ncbi:MAG: NusG domain II-containing protein [Oscillospiraceae bacterium]|nr:NusG domain II-containing protein [Oscillospiraceae bacterium]
MKKKDLLVLLFVLLLAAVLFAYGLSSRTSQTVQPVPTAEEIMDFPSEESLREAETEKGAADNAAEAAREAARAYLEEYPAEAYLLVTTNNGVYSPIPLNGENAFRVKQGDGSENVVHIGKNSFYMESSNCDNQNCVGEGEVTLENRDSRILFNMVICLPHRLSLELLTPAETESQLMKLYSEQEAYQAELEAYLASHPESFASSVPTDGGKDENR